MTKTSLRGRRGASRGGALGPLRARGAPLALLVLATMLTGLLPPGAAFAQAVAPAASPSPYEAPLPSISPPSGTASTLAGVTDIPTPSSDGAARYSYPFALPAARGALQPALSLEYSSKAGSGAEGRGWTLPVRSIRRVPSSDPPKTNADYPYHLVLADGRKLTLVCAIGSDLKCIYAYCPETFPVWAAGWSYYRTEVDDGERYFLSKDRQTWRTQRKDGTTFEFGVPLAGPKDLDAIDVDPSAPGKVGAWYVARAYDHEGVTGGEAVPDPVNPIRYRYTHSSFQGKTTAALLTDVFDTPPATSSGSPSAAPDSAFAHHVHLTYVDSSALVPERMELRSVDVTSKPFDGEAGAPRELVRRYHLDYDDHDRAEAYLATVTLEGRCSAPIAEATSGLLPSTKCPRLAPDRFEYGLGPLTARFTLPLQFPWLTRPVPGLFGRDVEVGDFDGDGFSDVLDGSSRPYILYRNRAREGLPGEFLAIEVPGKVDVIVPSLSKQGPGEADESRAAVPVSALAAPSYWPLLSDPHVLLGDFDGDGATDMLLDVGPREGAWFITQDRTSASFAWSTQPIRAPLPVNIDRDTYSYAVVDINGDGKADVVRSDGEVYDTMLAGFTDAGDVTFVGDSTKETLHSCIMGDDDGATADLRRPDVALADMNGDGKADVVLARSGRVLYWPGHGDGHFGTGGDPCEPSTRPHTSFVTANAPTFARPSETQGVRIADVDRDGYADLLVFDGTTATVHRNELGLRWTRVPLSVPGLPPMTRGATAVRMVVLGGGGGTTILHDGADFRLHPVAITSPDGQGLLHTVHTSSGATSTFHYIHATDVVTGQPNQPLHTVVADDWLVSSLSHADNLDRLGQTGGVYTTEFAYEQPVYRGGRQGYAVVTATKRGLTTADDVIVRSTFNYAYCRFQSGNDDDCGETSKDALATRRSLDFDPLAGTLASTEVMDGGGHPLSTTIYNYEVRHLTGDYGAPLYFVGPRAVDTYRFDPAAPASPETTTFTGAEIIRFDVPRHLLTSTIVLPSSSGRVRLRMSYDNDDEGNTIETRDEGCVEGCGRPDEIIATHNVVALHPGDQTAWGYRVLSSRVSGTRHSDARVKQVTYDALGRPTIVQATLSGTLPLERHHALSTATIAPPPANASQDGQVTLATLTYDAFGNVVKAEGATAGCATFGYDDAYRQLLVSTTVDASAAPTAQRCAGPGLQTSFAYDRGLGRVTSTTAPTGAVGRQTYDAFGRMSERYAPDPTKLGQTSAMPSVRQRYVDRTAETDLPFASVTSEWLDDSGASALYRQSWTYRDAFQRPILRLVQADPAKGDGGDWVASGRVERGSHGQVVKAYAPWFTNMKPATDIGQVPAPTEGFDGYAWDAFGRMTAWTRRDGSAGAQLVYHALSYDTSDALALDPGGAHAGTPTTKTFDGHGRIVVQTTRQHEGSSIGAINLTATYLPTGEPETLTQVHVGTSDAPVMRWMRYDTLGRLVLNVEPNTSPDYTADTTVDAAKVPRAWRYAWSDSGQLVGTSDPRGCGKNLFYDAAGRPIAEDYSPCLETHALYSPPDLTTGDGAEVFNVYDTPPADLFGAAGLTANAALYTGALAATYDRGAQRLFVRDGRGRVTEVAERVVKPGFAQDYVSSRYAAHWYKKSVARDDLGRTVSETTGAEVAELLATGTGASGASVLSSVFDARGFVRSVTSSYGALVTASTYAADGLPESVTYGDAAKTTTTIGYDGLRRLKHLDTSRGAAPAWSAAPSLISPPPAATDEPTRQLLLESLSFTYDAGGNPTKIVDGRDPAAWPSGAKPVTRSIAYDDLERVRRVDFDYGGRDHTDAWVSPEGPEQKEGAAVPAVRFGKRVRWLTYDYDWLGNRVHSSDDAGGFVDRSLGEEHIADKGGPNRLSIAANTTEPGTPVSTGSLGLQYDVAGNVTRMDLGRDGPCLQASCDQTFIYEWDEVGRLQRAARYDAGADPMHGDRPGADLHYAYDGGNGRVLKSAGERHTLYVFSTLEERASRYDGASQDYERTAATEQVLLGSLGRVVWDGSGMPTASGEKRHVLLSLPDALGSTSTVIDHATGELVEKVTYAPAGGTESDYRPERWKSVREAYRFTGKEDDLEVGLTYFGHRYLAPALGRWLSPDPLAIHALGADLNPYAYVGGRVMQAVDPTGLERCDSNECRDQANSGGGGGADQQAPANSDGTLDPGWGETIIVTPDGVQKTKPDPWAYVHSPIAGYQFLPGDRSGVDAAGVGPHGSSGGKAGASECAGLRCHSSAPPMPGAVYPPTLSSAAGSTVAFGLETVVTLLTGPVNTANALRLGERAQDSISDSEAVAAMALAAVFSRAAGKLAGSAIGAAMEEAEGSTYVYQLVDEGGDAVYYGISNDPARRLAEHALEATKPFSGMQVISEGQPLAQAQALETSLIQQAHAEGRLIYNVAPQSISPLIPVQVPSTVVPSQTLLNPALYPR